MPCTDRLGPLCPVLKTQHMCEAWACLHGTAARPHGPQTTLGAQRGGSLSAALPCGWNHGQAGQNMGRLQTEDQRPICDHALHCQKALTRPSSGFGVVAGSAAAASGTIEVRRVGLAALRDAAAALAAAVRPGSAGAATPGRAGVDWLLAAGPAGSGPQPLLRCIMAGLGARPARVRDMSKAVLRRTALCSGTNTEISIHNPRVGAPLVADNPGRGPPGVVVSWRRCACVLPLDPHLSGPLAACTFSTRSQIDGTSQNVTKYIVSHTALACGCAHA